jgi:DNA-binding transcriptional regulator YiaG
MKYKSEILEVLHENAVEMYKIGGITEASMREYYEVCLSSETSGNNTAKGDIAHEAVNIEHADLVTV